MLKAGRARLRARPSAIEGGALSVDEFDLHDRVGTSRTIAAAGTTATVIMTPNRETGSAVADPIAPGTTAAIPTTSESNPGDIRRLI